MLAKTIRPRMRPERVHNNRQWVGPYLRQVRFARQSHDKRELLDRWNKLRINSRPITAGICAIPPNVRKQNRIKPVQTKATTFVVLAESLVAKAGSETVRAKEGRQKMTLGVAVAATLLKDFGRCAGDRSQSKVA